MMTSNPSLTSVQRDREALEVSRREVRDMLLRSQAFRALPPDRQREIAQHTVEIATYLAAPDGIRGDTLPTAQTNSGRPTSSSSNLTDPYSVGLADSPTSARRSQGRGSNANQDGVFTAQAAREGAAVAGALLREVNFPTFVSGLINGVFNAIVESSIRQMEAYGDLVKSVAQSLNQFRDENVSANQGRDHLVDQFPDVFEVSVDTGSFDEGGGPRVRLREGVDEQEALAKVNGSALMDGGKALSSLDDESIEGQLVPAARTQLATSRQQLLATMVLMGINRIIVTDGKISAKVMYDFQARDNMKYRRSATRFDYDPTLQNRTWEGESESEYQGGDRTRSRSTEAGKSSYTAEESGASYYSKGTYKATAAPVMTAMSASTTDTDASLTTKASLAGVVEINFRSETFPLEKMADSFQIGMIQNASMPARGGRGVGGGTGNTGGGATTGGSTPPAP